MLKTVYDEVVSSGTLFSYPTVQGNVLSITPFISTFLKSPLSWIIYHHLRVEQGPNVFVRHTATFS